jgi:hypothetical protein
MGHAVIEFAGVHDWENLSLARVLAAGKNMFRESPRARNLLRVHPPSSMEPDGIIRTEPERRPQNADQRGGLRAQDKSRGQW